MGLETKAFFSAFGEAIVNLQGLLGVVSTGKFEVRRVNVRIEGAACAKQSWVALCERQS
jgi:hypothetical protein